MKKAVAHLEQFLDRLEGVTKRAESCSRPCSATCTTSARTSSTRSSATTATRSTIWGKQVPMSAILEKGGRSKRGRDRALGPVGVDLENRCRSASRSRMRAESRSPIVVGGAAINRDFSAGASRSSTRDRVFEPGVFYAKDAFEGPWKSWTAWSRRPAERDVFRKRNPRGSAGTTRARDPRGARRGSLRRADGGAETLHPGPRRPPPPFLRPHGTIDDVRRARFVAVL